MTLPEMITLLDGTTSKIECEEELRIKFFLSDGTNPVTLSGKWKHLRELNIETLYGRIELENIQSTPFI